MKKQLLSLGFCLIALTSFAQQRFSGQVKNAKSDFVLVERPFDGQYLPQKPEKLELSRAGKFEIDLQNTTTGFVLLHIDDQKLRIFVQPNGETSEMVADMKDFAGTVRFTGPYAIENAFLQTLPRIALVSGNKLSQVYNPFYKAGATPKETWTEVTDYLESEKKLLKKAAKEGFSGAFAKAVESDIHMYYHSLFGSVAYRQWQAALKAVPYRFDSGWSNYWKKMNTDDCLDNLPAAVSEWYLVFLEQYIREYRLDFLKESEFADADTQRGEQFLEYDRLIYQNLKPNVQEYAAAGIYAEAALQGKREPILVELKDKFKADFPDSKFNEPLAELLGKPAQQNGQMEDETAHVFSPGIQVLGQDKEINTIRELIAPFKGKVVYMDIWATWCSPCMFELSQHEPLDKFAKGKDIVLLYVSVDDEERTAKWQKVIEDKHLTGYHVMVNLALRDELIQQFGDGQNLALPTYLIFDKKGKLAVRDAKQPSHNTLLFNQLSEYLK